MADRRSSRKIKQGPLEADYENSAIIVNYVAETTHVDGNDKPNVVTENKKLTIKIKDIFGENLARMAEAIVENCKYIHNSRVEEVEQLLTEIKSFEKHRQEQGPPPSATAERKKGAPSMAAVVPMETISGGGPRERSDRGDHGDRGDRGDRDRERGDRARDDRGTGGKPRERETQAEPSLPPADINKLDDYLDLLYEITGKSERDREEGLQKQIMGTGMILQLCRHVMHLEQLIQNNTLMQALTRVLQDEHKKSIDLTFNILRIFLAFSNFMEMHSIMANYRVGILTMKAIEYEIMRAKELSKTPRLAKKQEKLLFASFYLLINLAEDPAVERKMIKKNLLDFLVSSLDYTYGDLLILVVTFLKKMSIFEENKNLLKEANVVTKLNKFLSCSSQPLTNVVMRCMFNLSFDADCRDQMMQSGLVPKLVSLLKIPAFRGRTLKLLYHLSADDRCKSMITYTEAIPMLMGMIVNFPQPLLAKELAAVAVNLSHVPRNVEIMVGNRGLNYLMDRLGNTKDPLLLKVIRNVTYWTFQQQLDLDSPETQYRYRGLWSPHVKIFLELMNERDNADLMVEVLGCLANLTASDLPATATWSKLLRDNNLLNIINRTLSPGMAQNDTVLEIIMLISTMCSDSQACGLLASGNIINLLYQTWKERGEDVEIKLQLIYCFYRLLLNDKSREEVMYSTRIVIDFIDCLSHKNSTVRSMADRFCELVLEFDRQPTGDLGKLGVLIRKKRFEGYNQHWIVACPLDLSVTAQFTSNAANYDDDLVSLGPNGLPGPGVNPALYYGDSKMGDGDDFKMGSKDLADLDEGDTFQRYMGEDKMGALRGSPDDKDESWENSEDSNQWRR